MDSWLKCYILKSIKMKKHMYKNIKVFFATLLLIVAIPSCTNLDEKIYSDLSGDNFYKNKVEILQGALRPFTHMQAWMAPTGQNGYYYHAELSADQLAWPQKGKHGYDGGDHFRQHYHTWTSDEGRMRGAWSLIWTGVGYINAAIADMEKVDYKEFMTEEEMTAIISELYVLRAFHYMKIMELWGNTPIVTEVGEGPNPPTRPKKDLFEFAKTELETHVPKLLPYSKELVGRVSQTAGYAMLAELYLNAEYFVGVPMWDECIKACDKIMSGEAGGLGAGNKPELADNLSDSFSNTNQSAKESLFQFAFSKKGGFTFGWDGFFCGYSNTSEIHNVDYSGWNAFVVIPTAFDNYPDNDLRKKEWFMFGPQYKYGTDEPILGTEEYNGKPLEYVNYIRRESERKSPDEVLRSTMADGEENSGARFDKYKSGPLTDDNYRENHYLLYRLTEIYYNKAEALMRKNGGKATQEAVDLINICRQRAFSDEDWEEAKYTTETLTMDELLNERGREFIFEGKRRTDLIRFGKFTTASWWDHKPSNDPNKEIYPIPHTQIGANPNLKQNPGYE